MAEELTEKELKKRHKEELKAARAAAKERRKNGEMTEEEEEASGGFLLVIVAILIVIVWLAIFALLIKMDVGGFGSTVLYPILKDVPYVNKILPESTEYAEEDSAYHYDTMEDAVAEIKRLEKQLKKAKAAKGDNEAYIADLEVKAAELEEYKAKEKEFEKKKEKFYEEVVFGDKAPDITQYRAYYEEIEPANAEVIYKQVVNQIQENEDIEKYVKAYSDMKPAQAAAIFDTMTDNLKLVGKILWNMESDARGKILGKMDSETAARVTELMEPKTKSKS